MNKPSIWVGLGTFALLASAWAGDFKLPDDSPVASFSIPASWKPAEYEDGVEAVSDDESVHIAVEATDLSSIESAQTERAAWQIIEDAMKASLSYLKKKGVELDESTEKETRGKLNDMEVLTWSLRGKDSEGDCNVSLNLVVASAKKGLLLTYWASPEGEKKNSQELTQILHSIKPIGR